MFPQDPMILFPLLLNTKLRGLYPTLDVCSVRRPPDDGGEVAGGWPPSTAGGTARERKSIYPVERIARTVGSWPRFFRLKGMTSASCVL